MIGAVYRAHVRLVLRDWAIWVAMALGLAFVAWFVDMGGGLITLFGAGDFIGLFLPLMLLGLLLSAAGAAQRERGASLGETLEALPYKPAAWVAGRLLALIVPWLAATTLVLGAAVVLIVWRDGAPPDPLLFWIWTLALLPGVFAAATVGFTLGLAFPKGFAAHLIAVLIAVAAATPFVSEILADLLPLNPPTVYDWTFSSFFAFSPFGHFPDGYLLLLNRLFALGIGFGSAALPGWLLARQGRRPGERRLLAATAIGFALAGAAIVLSSGVWAGRMADYAAEVKEYRRPVRPVDAIAPAVAAYDISLQMEPGQHRMGALARLDLPAPGETGTFTLRRSFAVAGVSGPDGAPVPFEREGDLLVLATGSRPGPYTVRYSGEVWQWRPYSRFYSMWLAAHISGRSVMLPSNYGWYPVPGGHTLTYPGGYCKGACRTFLVDPAVEHAPARFAVQVSGLDGLSVATNAGGGRPLSGAWLIATPAPAEANELWAWKAGPHTRRFQLTAAELLRPQIEFYRELVPSGAAPVMIEVPESSWFGRERQREWHRNMGFPGAVLLMTSVAEVQQAPAVSIQLFRAWWGEPRNAEERMVQYVVWLFAQEVIDGERQEWRELRLGKTDREALDGLRQYYGAHGAEAAKRLLQRLHNGAAGQPLTWKAFQRTIAEGES